MLDMFESVMGIALRFLSSILESPSATAAIGAIAGAVVGSFSTFFIGMLNERVRRHRKRWIEHFNALVSLERELNENTGILYDNRVSAMTISNGIAKSTEAIPMIWAVPHTLPRNTTIHLSFLRPELVNDMFSYNVKIRKLNNDISMIRESYGDMRQALLRKDITREHYQSSVREYCCNLTKLIKAYDLMDKRTLDLLVKTRVAIKLDRLQNSNFFIRRPQIAELTKTSIQAEQELMRKEIDETMSKSKSEIDEFL